MKSDERRQAIKRQREQLIQDLEAAYMAAFDRLGELEGEVGDCLLYTSPSPRDKRQSRMPSSA